jgi:hypothetical protein
MLRASGDPLRFQRRTSGFVAPAPAPAPSPPSAIFDGFIAMYGSQRPDWVTGSELDLRPGGRWTVDFQVLSELASRMSAG